MGKVYAFLVWLDQKDYRFTYYQKGWKWFEPKKEYKIADILSLLATGIVLGLFQIGKLVYTGLEWINNHCSIEGK